jgi:hypothetical protein
MPGRLISAILCLLRQKWRTSINRAAEAMTIFAVVCAGIFPGLPRRPRLVRLVSLSDSQFELHLAELPISAGVGCLCCLDLWNGLGTVLVRRTIARPCDLARSLHGGGQPRSRGWLYGFFAMGWRGSNRHWSNYEMAYLILAGISTPLVLSVHTIVSFDFAVSLIPGWHTTIFPPYFVAGAIFSGFGMVLTLMLPLRAIYGLQDLITQYHIDCMCKITLATGTIVGYAYATEFFIAWYGANPYEGFAFINRAFGHYAWAYWIMIGCNVITPQFFWFKSIRQNTSLVWILSIFVNVGMWFERFVIIVTSLARDFLPSSWGYYSPSIVEIFTFFGTFGVFSVLFLLFIRFLPIMPMAELKAVTPQADPHGHGHSSPGHERHGAH